MGDYSVPICTVEQRLAERVKAGKEGGAWDANEKRIEFGYHCD